MIRFHKISVKQLAAICLGISLLAFSAPVSAQQIRDETVGVAAAQLWFRAPSSGYDAIRPGIARVALAAAAAGRPAHGTTLAERIAAIGGRLAVAAYPDMCMVAIEVPSDRFSSALGWLRHAYNAPDIDDDAVKAGVRDATLDGTLAQYESSRALRDALFAHLYAAGPAREPAVPPLSGTLPFTVGDVQAFARRAFRAANTILTTAGNTSVPSEVPAGVDAIADSVLGHSRIPGAVVGAALNGLAIGWPGPAISDARAATAMDFIGDYLFNPDTGILKDVAGLDGQFLTLHDPGVLVVTAPGDDAALRDRILAAVETMRSPLPVTAFEGARAAFIFHTLAEAQTPLARAETEGWYAAQGDSAYAPVDASGRYVAYAQGLNANDVAAVAKRYLHDPIVVRARISK